MLFRAGHLKVAGSIPSRSESWTIITVYVIKTYTSFKSRRTHALWWHHMKDVKTNPSDAAYVAKDWYPVVWKEKLLNWVKRTVGRAEVWLLGFGEHTDLESMLAQEQGSEELSAKSESVPHWDENKGFYFQIYSPAALYGFRDDSFSDSFSALLSHSWSSVLQKLHICTGMPWFIYLDKSVCI